MTDRALTVGSLFTGIGGFDLGFERAGMTISWQCEYDESARRILGRHWPETPCYPDVKELSGDGLTDVDVLCGGFPCQDLSVAGRRKGLAGERSGLFHQFMRLADDLAPRWVVVENVPGLLSSGHKPDCSNERCGCCEPGADMATVLGTLADLGYGWAYRVLDAQYFGVAQRRRRVFIVGCAGGRADRAATVLFESSSCDGDTAPSREAGARVAATLKSGTASGSGVNANIVVSTLQGGGKRGCRIDAEMAADGHLVPVAPESQTLAVAYSVAVRGRQDGQEWELGEPDIGNALRAGDGGSSRGNWALTPQMAVRRLLPVECERLQGFPDGWTEGESDSSRYARLGNAVAVPVAEWIGRQLMEAA